MYDTLENIIKKHEKIITLSKLYMDKITDYEHDSNHVQDVINNIMLLASNLDQTFDLEVCVIAGY